VYEWKINAELSKYDCWWSLFLSSVKCALVSITFLRELIPICDLWQSALWRFRKPFFLLCLNLSNTWSLPAEGSLTNLSTTFLNTFYAQFSWSLYCLYCPPSLSCFQCIVGNQETVTQGCYAAFTREYWQRFTRPTLRFIHFIRTISYLRGFTPWKLEMLRSAFLGSITDYQNHDRPIADHRMAGEW